MKLTRELLMRHRTPKGAWTKTQMLAIGLTWPPKPGWREGVVGKRLTDQQFHQFTGINPAQGLLFG